MEKMNLSLDWLSFTYKPDLTRLEEKFGLDSISNKYDIDYFFMDFPEFDAVKDEFLILSGFSHYENILGFLGISDTCRICFNTPDYTEVNMGVNVSIPSHGLEWFFNLLNINKDDFNAVQQMFVLLRDRDCTLSRIDLAFDDFSKTFRPKQYVKWWYNDCIRTKFRKMSTSSSLRSEGHTFYLGTRTSGKMLRIYDKDIESNGEIDAVRYEFELHGKHAKDMFQYLIDNIGLDFVSYLRSYFEVIDVDSCPSNRSYCTLLLVWEEFLNKLKFNEQLPSKAKIPCYSIENRKTDTTYWLLNNCLRTIKGYVSVFGWESLHTRVCEDTRDIPDKYKTLLLLAQRTDWDECFDE